jgi:hypothetical protein
VLTNTSSHFADKTAWNDRLKLVREKGIAAFAAPNMERWFTKQFRERAPETVAWLREMFAATPLDGYLGCGEAVRDMDHRDLLPKIKAPTLVVAGKYDPATPPEANEYIKNHIPGARYTFSRRRISPMSSRRTPTPMRCWDSCSTDRSLSSQFNHRGAAAHPHSSGEPCWISGQSGHRFWRGMSAGSGMCLPCDIRPLNRWSAPRLLADG